MKPSLSIHLPLSAVAIALVLVAGCSSGPDAPAGGTGGGAAASGGKPGSGGAPATGGQTAGGAPGSGGAGGAGAGGAGGTAAGGSGGTAAGGNAATGGSPGTGGGGGTSTGGAPGNGGQGGSAGPDASNDKGPDVTAPIDSNPPTGPSLDACFAGLRALSGASQLATKRSADGKIETRIALEVDGFGTSGTKAWRLIRIAVVTPDAKVCWNDENALRTAYKGSHHNCSDVLTVSAGGRTYEFKAPDTDPKRGDTTLTIITGATTGPATKLTTSSCKGGSPTATCTSGGPC